MEPPKEGGLGVPARGARHGQHLVAAQGQRPEGPLPRRPVGIRHGAADAAAADVAAGDAAAAQVQCFSEVVDQVTTVDAGGEAAEQMCLHNLPRQGDRARHLPFVLLVALHVHHTRRKSSASTAPVEINSGGFQTGISGRSTTGWFPCTT